EGPCHWILKDNLDGAPGGRRAVEASVHRVVSFAEARQLAQVPAKGIDREELAIPGGVRAKWVRRCDEVRPAALRVEKPRGGIHAAEAGQLQNVPSTENVLSTEKEDLIDLRERIADEAHRRQAPERE